MWSDPEIVRWVVFMLDSFRHYTGNELIERSNPIIDARNLFEASIVVVSHGLGDDPILNYGNQSALRLWEMDWAEFTTTPSRLTAKPVDRDARRQMLEEVTRRGYIGNYEGERVTKSGATFRIYEAEVWNILDPSGVRLGHGATFPRWMFL